jgi:hypothetical protein
MIKVAGARGNNLKDVTGRNPAGHLHLRDRRFGRRQVHLPDRDALQGGGAAHQRRAREPRRTTASTGWNISTR